MLQDSMAFASGHSSNQMVAYDEQVPERMANMEAKLNQVVLSVLDGLNIFCVLCTRSVSLSRHSSRHSFGMILRMRGTLGNN